MTLSYLQKMKKRTGDLDTSIKINSKDLGMEFGIEKCALLIMKSGKKQKSGRNRTAKPGKLQELGIMEMDIIKQTEMKQKKKKNKKRVA